MRTWLLLAVLLGAVVLTVVIVFRRQGDGPDGQNETSRMQNKALPGNADDRRSDSVAENDGRMPTAAEGGAPPSALTEPLDGSAQEDRGKDVAPAEPKGSGPDSLKDGGIPVTRAIAIARKECEGVIQIPDDAVVEVEEEGTTFVVTFRIPIKTPRPGASYYARIVMDAKTGTVIQRFGPDA